jgi:hypothetical protein
MTKVARPRKPRQMKKPKFDLTSLYPPSWVTATLAIIVIFVVMYALRVDRPALTPNEQMLQNTD